MNIYVQTLKSQLIEVRALKAKWASICNNRWNLFSDNGEEEYEYYKSKENSLTKLIEELEAEDLKKSRPQDTL